MFLSITKKKQNNTKQNKAKQNQNEYTKPIFTTKMFFSSHISINTYEHTLSFRCQLAKSKRNTNFIAPRSLDPKFQLYVKNKINEKKNKCPNLCFDLMTK